VTTVDLAQINAEARKIQPAAVAGKALRLLLAFIARVLWGTGWIVRKTFAALWFTAAWSWTAVKLGWHDAGPAGRTPRS
jgi:hypothetical protein